MPSLISSGSCFNGPVGTEATDITIKELVPIVIGAAK